MSWINIKGFELHEINGVVFQWTFPTAAEYVIEHMRNILPDVEIELPDPRTAKITPKRESKLFIRIEHDIHLFAAYKAPILATRQDRFMVIRGFMLGKGLLNPISVEEL